MFWDKATEDSFVQFKDAGESATGKTRLYAVVARDGSALGHVHWFGRWRKYCFFPASGSTFDDSCLRSIADFCQSATQNHRSAA